MNGTSTKGTESFGYVVYRNGEKVSIGYWYDTPAEAKDVALAEARAALVDTPTSYVIFMVAYKFCVQRWTMNRDGTATSYVLK